MYFTGGLEVKKEAEEKLSAILSADTNRVAIVGVAGIGMVGKALSSSLGLSADHIEIMMVKLDNMINSEQAGRDLRAFVITRDVMPDLKYSYVDYSPIAETGKRYLRDEFEFEIWKRICFTDPHNLNQNTLQKHYAIPSRARSQLFNMRLFKQNNEN